MNLKNRLLLITAIILSSTILFYNLYLIDLKNSFIQNNMESYNKNFIQTYDSIHPWDVSVRSTPLKSRGSHIRHGTIKGTSSDIVWCKIKFNL